MRKISTILLVDDNDTTNFLHQRLLDRLDVFEQVLVAGNGQQALEVLAQSNAQFSPANPLLILLDLNMPVMDGFEFLEAFQALPPRATAVCHHRRAHLFPERPGPGPHHQPARRRIPQQAPKPRENRRSAAAPFRGASSSWVRWPFTHLS